MARYRIKFLLQEFDLVGPEVVIGRSPECHVTVEDPLISRQHARILISGDSAQIMDLGSRNGTHVNGERIEGAYLLEDRDRIRLGTQELLFYVAQRGSREAKTTGFLAVCAACNVPYPDTATECPHCGAPATGEDETFSGFAVEPQRSWTYQLLGEVVDRALEAGRLEEAARMFRRVAREVEIRLDQGDRLEPAQLEIVAGYAISLAQAANDPSWISWALDLYVRHSLIVSETLARRMVEIERFPALPASRGYVQWAEQRKLDGAGLGILRDAL